MWNESYTLYFKVAAANAYGESPYSAMLMVDLTSILLLPPTAVRAEVDVGRVTLTWSDPATTGEQELLSFRIYRGAHIAQPYLTEVPADANEYVDTSVEPGETYHYTLASVSRAGESARSARASATLPDVPSSPYNLVTSQSGGDVILRWSPPNSEGGRPITGYRVYRVGDSGVHRQIGTIEVNDENGHRYGYYRDRSAGADEAYVYYVTAVNEVGESEHSRSVSVTVSEPTSLSPVFLVAAVVLMFVVLLVLVVRWEKDRRARLKRLEEEEAAAVTDARPVGKDGRETHKPPDIKVPPDLRWRR
jgi:fibronectin type 3 domain-containing protein